MTLMHIFTVLITLLWSVLSYPRPERHQKCNNIFHQSGSCDVHISNTDCVAVIEMFCGAIDLQYVNIEMPLDQRWAN